MKNLLLSLILLVSAFNLAIARPATPKPFHIRQSDNTTLTLHLKGDEFCHYFSTMDNVPVIQKSDNSYYYAKLENGLLVASDVLAHDPSLRQKAEIGFIQENKYKVMDLLNSLRSNSPMLKSRAAATATNSQDESFNHIGQKKMLIILAEFPNKAMKHSREIIDQQYNQVGYCQSGHIGSVHDYFYDQSYGNFDLTFDVVGPFITKENMKHYGQNDWSGNDSYVGELVTEAVQYADEFVDFKDYDWDGDGEVEQIFILYAGYGESSGASPNTIWPHQYWLSYCQYKGDGEGPITLDGVVIDKYACANELTGTTGSHLDGIGAFCHEFGHCLGLPDFYDTETNTAFGMSYWDVMDAGNYNGPYLSGEVPSGYSAYERWKCGWLDYIELERTTHIEGLSCIADEPKAYIIKCPKRDNEYLLLENRQNRDWFSYVGYSMDCHGMLVTHVDYKKSFWEGNMVNNSAKHQRMSYIPADNNFSYYYESDFEGDLFPGLMNVTELTPESHKTTGGMWYNGTSRPKLEFDKYLINISEKDELISFDFIYDMVVPIPSITLVEVESENNIRVHWESEDDVDFYEIEISEVVEINDGPGDNENPDNNQETENGENQDNSEESKDSDQNSEATTVMLADDNNGESGDSVEPSEPNDSMEPSEPNDPVEPVEPTTPTYYETKIVVEGQECVFEGLESGNYKVRMRSNYWDTYSQWSDYEYITITANPDGILTIEADSHTPIAIYNLQGIRINEIKSSGVYIFQYPNRTFKRFVHL